MNKQLVILAAGMGSRFGGIKQIASVTDDGRTLPEISAADAAAAGFDGVVFIIRPEIEADFKEMVGSRVEKFIEVRYCMQTLDRCLDAPAPADRTKPWGTGHALLCAAEAVDRPFVVINADDYYGPGSYKTAAEFLDSTTADGDIENYALVGFSLDKTLSENGTVSRGICVVNDQQLLIGVGEHTDIRRGSDGIITGTSPDGDTVELADNAPASMNFWAFTPGVFDILRQRFAEFAASGALEKPRSEFYLPAAVDSAIVDGQAQVRLLTSTEQWMGMTYSDDLEILRAHLATR